LLTIYTFRPLNRNMAEDGTLSDGGGRVAATVRGVPRDHPIALFQSHSLPALVEREIAHRILAGELHAGAKLNEADIAQHLGVSRGPVREAFRALEASGLVRFEKNRGVYVREVSGAEADEIFELRALLDDFAGRRVAERAADADLRALGALVERMDAATRQGDADRYFELNLAFHDRIIALAGNAKLCELYRRLVNELSLFRRASFDHADNMPRSAAEHRAIVERIAARDPDAAGRLLREHAAASRERARHARAPVAVAPPQPRRAIPGRPR
jgi:phosphonate utilization transcriptional regulator